MYLVEIRETAAMDNYRPSSLPCIQELFLIKIRDSFNTTVINWLSATQK